MTDPRLYRAALVPVLLALVLLGFSLENRPRALTTTLAPDAFAGDRAFDRAYGSGGLADRFADRRPGSLGDERLADLAVAQMREAGFRVRSIVHEGETIDGKRSLRTIVAERTGTVDERVVVVAHRDAAAPRAEAELSATAALLELARVFGAPRQTQRTLTLVSTSGGSGGSAGAARLADELSGEPVAGVLVLGDLASRNLRVPLLSPWSNNLGGSPARLRTTLQDALRLETGGAAKPPRALSQATRFALPATYGEQGVLLARGLPAIALSIGGDRAPPAGAPVSRERLTQLGRAALRTVTALDGAPRGRRVNARASSADLVASRKVLPGWAVRLFVGALLLAPLVVAVDALAAVRRAREPILTWLRWTLVSALPLVVTAVFAIALGAVGLMAATPGTPVPPDALPAQAPALLAVALVLVLAWAWLRPAVLRLARARDTDVSAPAAGRVVLLVAVLAAVVVWIGNPYAAAPLVPAAHLWLFALAADLSLRRAVRVALVALGILPVAIVAVLVARALGLGGLDAAWELLLVVAGGHVSLLSVLVWSALGGCAAAALTIAWHSRAREDADDLPITVRGPRSYAGPGSLGGTESALRK